MLGAADDTSKKRSRHYDIFTGFRGGMVPVRKTDIVKFTLTYIVTCPTDLYFW